MEIPRPGQAKATLNISVAPFPGGCREEKGGQGRNVFCTLLFCNYLIIFYLHLRNHVKCVDFLFFYINK